MEFNMHDWTLQKVKSDWVSGLLEIHLSSYDREYTIKVRDFLWFELSMEENWGPSNSILSSSGVAKGRESDFFSLTIQSGDALRVEGREISIAESSKAELLFSSLDDSKTLDLVIDLSKRSVYGKMAIQLNFGEVTRVFFTRTHFKSTSHDIEGFETIKLESTKNLSMIYLASGDRINIEAKANEKI